MAERLSLAAALAVLGCGRTLAGFAGIPTGMAITGGWVTSAGSVVVVSQGTNAVWRRGVP